MKYVYDGWGNLTNFQQDRDSAVGGSGYKEVAYAYAKATTGRNTLRRTSQTLPNAAVFNYAYSSAGGLLDADASRVTQIQDGSNTPLVTYDYNGAGQVVRTYYEEPDVMWKLSGSSAGSYPDLDAFNRVAVSKWTSDLSTDRDFYNVALSYDENSNITVQNDAVHTGHDVKYSNDDLNRLIVADEGTWNGSSITSRTRKQEWALNQTGNWNTDKVDLNGDGDWGDANELNDTRVHNAVNELSTRDTDSNSSVNYTFAYDAAGNMTDDGELYTYEWDAFGRMRKVRNRGDASLISEYWYNGLGYLITRHQDTNRSGSVTSDDKKYHTVYDERWRPVATYRGADANPKEQFVYHCAGAGVRGGISYIDACALRDKDASTAWTSAADSTLDERVYYCQNWRADVVAIVSAAGDLWEWVKYSAYGVPFGMPAGDCDSDGDCDGTDATTLAGWIGGAYDVRGDLDLDGDVDSTDQSLQSGYSGTSLGRGVLTNIDNRKGYAGYEFDWYRGRQYHVRHRVLDATLGRWAGPDPRRYVEGHAHFQYSRGTPIARRDPRGTISEATETTQTSTPFPDCLPGACNFIEGPEIEILINNTPTFWVLRGITRDNAPSTAWGHCPLGQCQFHQKVKMQPWYSFTPGGPRQPVDCQSDANTGCSAWDRELWEHWHGEGVPPEEVDPLNPHPIWTGPGNTRGGNFGTGSSLTEWIVDASTPCSNQSTCIGTWEVFAAQGGSVKSSVFCACGCPP